VLLVNLDTLKIISGDYTTDCQGERGVDICDSVFDEEGQDKCDEEVPACYSEGPLFRKSNVQIRATVLTFGLRLGLGLELRLGLGSDLQLGLGLVGIVDFRNSGPSE